MNFPRVSVFAVKFKNIENTIEVFDKSVYGIIVIVFTLILKIEEVILTGFEAVHLNLIFHILSDSPFIRFVIHQINKENHLEVLLYFFDMSEKSRGGHLRYTGDLSLGGHSSLLEENRG
jgi:hypothetical protein